MSKFTDVERARIMREARAHIDGSWVPPREPIRRPPVEKSGNGATVVYKEHFSPTDEPPEAGERVRFATEYADGDQSPDAGLNLWLRDNLLHERQRMYKVLDLERQDTHEALVNVGKEFERRDHEHAEQIRMLERKIRSLERKLVTGSKGRR
jgi:hypothetical protein